MAQPSFKIGQLAADLILREINLEEGAVVTPQHTTIKPELIIREST